MKGLRWILLAVLCFSFLPAQARPALAGTPQKSGLVAIYAPSGPPMTTTSTAFGDMPHMKGNVYLRDTSDLAITFCAETWIAGGKRIFVRALVDGAVASPSDVVLTSAQNLETHCFTFVRNGVGAGVRTVRIQWYTDSGGTGYVYDRTLHVTFAGAGSDELSLLAVAAPSGPDQVITGGWTNISGVSGTLHLPAASDLAISFSAEAYATNDKRFFIRVLVDGQVAAPSDIVLAVGGFTGTRTFTLVKENVSSGDHSIVVQGLVDGGGEAHVADRTLKVVGVRRSGVKHAGSLMVPAPSGPWETTTSTSWVNIPDLSGSLYVPTSGDLAVSLSASIRATSGDRLFVRALVDGQPTSPSDVVLVTGEWTGSFAYTFVKRNVSRGTHTVTLQWFVDSGGTGYAGDRTLTAYTFAGQLPTLFVAMESERGETGYQYGGYFAPSVVNVDLGTGLRTFKPYVASRLFLEFPSVADYFLENSDDRFFVVPASNAGALGPYLKQYTEKYYREQVPSCFTVMKTEALTRADAAVDYSLYDRNGDGTVTRDELALTVILYQDTIFGEVRNIPAVPTSDGVTLDGSEIATVYTPDFDQPGHIGVFAHELAHVFIDAGDMYESFWDPTAPGPYSLMDQEGNHPHLDPYHKLHAGDWFDPIVVTQDGYYDIPAVEQQAWIYKLRDPGSHSGEFFLVENRQLSGYDQYLPDSGLAIWHIDESRMPDYRTAVEMEPAVGQTNPIQWHNYLYDGAGSLWGKDFWDDSTGSNARWHDGGDSQIGVWAIPPSGTTMRVFLDVPGPGVLVDLKPDLAAAPAGKQATLQIRLVNTGPSSDQFVLYTSLPGSWIIWSENPVSLGSYKEKIITLTVTPVWSGQNQIDFSVTGQSTFNAGVVTMHSGVLTPESGVYLPLVVRES
jgi:M6 family metalloprotease-like protein